MILLPLLVSLALADAPPLMTGIGNYHRAVVTSNPTAQKYFDQGLALFYAFHKFESRKSFAEAARLDPKCAMAWWGVAMANGPDINFTAVDKPATSLALEAIAQAKAVVKNPVEKELVEAVAKRFDKGAPETRLPLDKAYSNAMAKVWARHPKDPDVGSLYAESILILSPWNNWRKDGKPQPGTLLAVSTLESVLKFAPMHPMANHMFVHAVEASPHPEKALAAADRLCALQPALGHMVHMPSHIYVRTGRWGSAVKQNELAIGSDGNFAKRRGTAQNYVGYLAHNRAMLAFAATMIGQSGKAYSAMADLGSLVPPGQLKQLAPMLDGAFFMPLEIHKRFGKWDAILAEPDYLPEFPISRAMRHGFRSLALGAKGKPLDAEDEFNLFKVAREKIAADAFVGLNSAKSVLDLEEHFVAGELAILKGDYVTGIAELRKAVTLEDVLNYDEPPDWLIPTRHTLGVALIKAKRYDEAMKVYREDLRRLPNNGWSTLGVSQAYLGLGKMKEAKAWRAKFDAIWANADVAITSSCMCLPTP